MNKQQGIQLVQRIIDEIYGTTSGNKKIKVVIHYRQPWERK